MNLPEEWPTEEMIGAGVEKMKSIAGWNNEATIASAVFRAMFSVAPEPEPVAFRMRHHLETEERDWSVMPIRFLERNKHPVYVIELLYTRPADANLRKAAERAERLLSRLYPLATFSNDELDVLIDLRAALDKVKS